MSEAFVAVLRVHLHFPAAGSLKSKRAELRPIKAGLRQRLGVAVAEVAHHDAWQRSELAVALCGESLARCEEGADAVCRFLDARIPEGVRVERVFASWSDLEDGR